MLPTRRRDSASPHRITEIINMRGQRVQGSVHVSTLRRGHCWRVARAEMARPSAFLRGA